MLDKFVLLLHGKLRTVWTYFPVVAQFASLPKTQGAHLADKRLIARVRVFVLLFVLGQAETFCAKSTLQFLLRIMLLIVSLEGEFGLEGCIAAEDVALKDGRALCFS
jgi:hypothetical protein